MTYVFAKTKNYINIRPLVVARLTSGVTAVTGEGTEYVLLCNEVNDLENNYNPATGIITIPQDGIYHIEGIVGLTGVNVGESNSRIITEFITTPETIVFYDSDDSSAPPSGNHASSGSIRREFSTNDTIKLATKVQGGASKNVGVAAGCYFTMRLEAVT